MNDSANFKECTYEEIEEYVDGLLTVDPDDLDGEALRNSRIFSKLNRVYIQKSRLLAEQTNQLDKLEFNRRRRYLGKWTAEEYKKEPMPEAILKGDVDLYMRVDPLVIEFRNIVRETERIVKFMEDSKGQLRSRGFDIKNSIDFRKLMTGA